MAGGGGFSGFLDAGRNLLVSPSFLPLKIYIIVLFLLPLLSTPCNETASFGPATYLILYL